MTAPLDLVRLHALQISGAVIVCLGLALLAQSCRLRSAEAAGQEATAALQDAKLTSANWEAAAVASERKLAETVPGLEAELAAAKDAGAAALLASRTTASAHWDLDRARVCGESPPGSDTVPPESVPPAPRGDTAGPGESGLDVDLELETAVTADELGRIYTTTKAWGTGRLWGFELPRSEFTVAKETTTTVDPELRDALKAWRSPKPPRFAVAPRALKDWRAGWSCGVGGGVSHQGDGVLVAACVLGPQF